MITCIYCQAPAVLKFPQKLKITLRLYSGSMRDYQTRPSYEQTPIPERPPKKRRKRKMGSIIANILTKVIALGVLVMLILVLVLPEYLPSWKPARDNLLEYLTAGLEYYQEDPDYSEFKVERVMVMDLKADGVDIEYTLAISVPHTIQMNGHDIQVIEAFSANNSNSKNPVENDSIKYWKGTLTGKGEVTVRIVYEVKGYTVDWDISARNSGNLDDIPEDYTKNYTIDRWEVYDKDGKTYRDVDGDGEVPDFRFEPSNPLLKSLAEKIVGDEKNVYMCAYRINKFMKEGTTLGNETYGPFAYPDEGQMKNDRLRFYGKPKPAYVTLNDSYGDCDDQAILFLTLCRAVGIPGWLESGALYNQYALDPTAAWEGHGWGKILIPMKNGDLEEPAVDPVNNLFLKRDANRYSDWEDPGGERSEYRFSMGTNYKSHIKDGIVSDNLRNVFKNNNVTLPGDAKIENKDSIRWAVENDNGDVLYRIQDFTTEFRIFQERGDMPSLPLDIESYYTSWTYKSSTSISSDDIDFPDYYVTHYYNPHKSKLEIKV